MYKVIIDKVTMEFDDLDSATEFYGKVYKKADNLSLWKDNKLLARKAKD